jgi:hypothetical protein
VQLAALPLPATAMAMVEAHQNGTEKRMVIVETHHNTSIGQAVSK